MAEPRDQARENERLFIVLKRLWRMLETEKLEKSQIIAENTLQKEDIVRLRLENASLKAAQNEALIASGSNAINADDLTPTLEHLSIDAEEILPTPEQPLANPVNVAPRILPPACGTCRRSHPARPESKSLSDAVKRADLFSVRFYLCKGDRANIERRDKDMFGGTPLLNAAFKGHAEIVDELLNAGSNAQATNNFGATALHTACTESHEAVARRLLNHAGGDVNERYRENQRTPLHLAVKTGAHSIVRLLLERGANPMLRDKNDSTALHLACREHVSVPIIRMLLESGAEINAQNEEGQSPLHVAIYAGIDENVRYLFENGSDVRLVDKEGVTALDLARNRYHIIPEWINRQFDAQRP